MNSEIKELIRFIKAVIILIIGGVTAIALLYLAMLFMLIAKINEFQ